MLFFGPCNHAPRLTLFPWTQPAQKLLFASWALRSSWEHSHNKEKELELHFPWGKWKCILNWFKTNPIKRMKYSSIRSNWPKWSVSFQIHLPPTLQNKIEKKYKKKNTAGFQHNHISSPWETANLWKWQVSLEKSFSSALLHCVQPPKSPLLWSGGFPGIMA